MRPAASGERAVYLSLPREQFPMRAWQHPAIGRCRCVTAVDFAQLQCQTSEIYHASAAVGIFPARTGRGLTNLRK
jgi:hypothetical protein